MPRRSKQAASDPFATSRAIDALDPALHEFAERIVDRITAISGNQQLQNTEERQEVYKAIADVRYQVTEGNRAREANAKQIADFLTLLLKEQGAVSLGQTQLRAEFHDGMQAIGERMSDIEGRVGSIENEVASFRRSRDQSIADRHELRHDMDASKTHRAHLQTQMDAIAAAVERIEQILGGAPESEDGR
jgi:chromosome segregation ATPase